MCCTLPAPPGHRSPATCPPPNAGYYSVHLFVSNKHFLFIFEIYLFWFGGKGKGCLWLRKIYKMYVKLFGCRYACVILINQYVRGYIYVHCVDAITEIVYLVRFIVASRELLRISLTRCNTYLFSFNQIFQPKNIFFQLRSRSISSNYK